MNPIGSTETASELSNSSWQADASSLVPGLTVLYHPDLERVGDRVALPELNHGGTVLLSRISPELSAPGVSAAQGLNDPRISRRPIQLHADAEGGVHVDRMSSSTSIVIDDESLDQCRLSAGRIDNGVVVLLAGSVVLLLHRLDPFVPRDLPNYGMVGESIEILRLRREIRHLAPLDVPVLVRGESGTGKELVAKAIHNAGSRRKRAYVTVNLAALPASLAAAELFGADQGSFTGADRRRFGYFEQAQGGTLFLDEVGDASSELQALLLRVLENGEIQPLGAGKAKTVDVRVVAATDADLERGVQRGDFRAPLLYRLGGGILHLPALRERRDDFGRLFVFILRRELEAVSASQHLEVKARPWVPAGLVARLARYRWPGNVRQLRNVIRQLVVSYRHRDQICLDSSLDHLLGEVPDGSSPHLQDESNRNAEPKPSQAISRRPSEIREHELIEALQAARWHPQAAADRLGISRPSLYRLMDRCPSIRTAAELERSEIEAALKHHGSEQAAAEALRVSVIGLRRRTRQLRTK